MSSETFQSLGPYIGAGWLAGSAASTAGSRGTEGVPLPLLRRRMVVQGQKLALFNAGLVTTTRYRYRGSLIPAPDRRARISTGKAPDRDLRRARCGDDSHGGFRRWLPGLSRRTLVVDRPLLQRCRTHGS